MYKIFINDSVIIITNGDNIKTISPINAISIDEVEPLFRKILIDIDINKALTYYLQTENPKETMLSLQKKFKFIKAAGGLVVNKHNQYLVIKRNKKWDFPKGKADKGETMREAAKREVMEETGVKDLTVLEKAITTYHVYIIKKNLYLKKTNWYHMISLFEGELLPQAEEGISKVKWVDLSFMKEKEVKTYKSIAEIVNFLPDSEG